MRLKYRDQLWEFWRDYFDIVYLFNANKDAYKEISEKSFDYEKKKFDRAMLAYPTMVMFEHTTSKWYHRTEKLDDYYELTKEEMIMAFDIGIEDAQRSIDGMTNLFKIPLRITNESPERIDQIKSVRKSINKARKRIEAAEWYKDLIKNSNVVEEKFLKMKEENLKYKSN